jgi:ParB/RepB/Spo0J family partition protein
MPKTRAAAPAADNQIDFTIAIPEAAKAPTIVQIPRSAIVPDPDNPRLEADADLRASIASQGILEPLTVFPALGGYQLVDGERRWRAAEGVLESLPCIVREDLADPARRLAAQLVANTGKPLTPIEWGRAVRRLLDAGAGSLEEVARQLGKPRSTIAEHAKLLDLGPWVPLIERGRVPSSWAVRVLFPYAGCPDAVHAAALASPSLLELSEDGVEGDTIDGFEADVRQAYRPHLYPIGKSKDDERPRFSTSKHDAECSCGGITVELDFRGKRKCCGNPEWWKPLDAAAKKAAKAKEKASAKAAPARPSRPKGPVFGKLPEGHERLQAKSLYEAPKGHVWLTEFNGCWATRDRQGGEWDARVVVASATPAELARVVTREGERVAVKTSALRDAQSEWKARWEARAQALAAEVDARAQAFAPLSDAVARAVVRLAFADDTWRARQLLAAYLPAAEKHLKERDLTPHVSLHDHDAATLAGRLLASGGNTIEQMLQDEQEAARKEIRASPVPFLGAEPKVKAPTAKAKQTVPQKVPAYMAPMQPSAALAAIVGDAPLTRVEITKRLWTYIQKQGLQDKKNKRMIHADELLQPIFKARSVNMFDMTKLVSKHLKPTADAAKAPKAGKAKAAAPAHEPLWDDDDEELDEEPLDLDEEE